MATKKHTARGRPRTLGSALQGDALDSHIRCLQLIRAVVSTAVSALLHQDADDDSGMALVLRRCADDALDRQIEALEALRP